MSGQNQVNLELYRYLVERRFYYLFEMLKYKCNESSHYFRFSLEAHSKTMWSQTQKDLPRFLLMGLVGVV